MQTGIVNFQRVVNVFSGGSKRYRARCTGDPLRSYLPDVDGLWCESGGQRVDGDHRPRPGEFISIADVPGEPSTIALFVFAVVIAAGSYLVNRLTMGKIPKDRGETDLGPRNQFGGIQTIAQSGTPVPFVYGTARVGGNIIDSFETATIDEDKFIDPIENLDDLIKDLFGNDVTIIRPDRLSRSFSTLNTRLALCLGPVEAIGSIEIDERPITEYPGMVIQTRIGTNDQQSIPGFDRTVNTRLLADPVLFASPVTVTTQTEIETAEVVLQFQNGLYKIKGDGFRYVSQITIDVDYRIKDSVVWTNLGTFTVNDFATKAIIYRIRLPILDRNIYEIRVTRNDADTDEQTNFTGFTLFILNEVDFAPRNHPGLAMMAFQQLPGDQVSPVNPANYTAEVKGVRDIRQYTDETTFTTSWTDNPAWCAGDFITNPEIGMGKFFTWAQIDIISFMEWAAYCDELVDDGNGFLEKRATFNRAFSTPTSGWDVLQTMVSGSGAMLVYTGSKFSAVIDRPSPQVQTFTNANTIPGSFGKAWFPKSELPRRAFARYFNEDNSYKLDSTMAEDPAALPGERLVEKRFDLLHISRITQVNRELMRVVNYNRFVTKGVELKCGLQGAQLKLGDVIGVSAKSLAIGKGAGALIAVAADDKTLQLDDEITMSPGTTYEIEIQHKDDGVIVRKELVAVTGTVTTDFVTTVDAFWPRELKRGDKYAVGVLDETVEQYRIDDLSKGDFGKNFEMTIKAGLYDERVFDLTPGSSPIDPITIAPGRNNVPRRIDDDDFNLSFRLPPTLRRHGRQRRRTIDVDWEAPADFSADHFEVWWRELEQTWILGATTKGRRAELEVGIDADTTYEIAVRGVSSNGLSLPLSGAVSSTVHTAPEPAPAPPVELLTSLGAFYRGDEPNTGSLIDAYATPSALNFGTTGAVPFGATGIIGTSRGPNSNQLIRHQRNPAAGDPWDLTANAGENSISVSMWVYMVGQTTDQAFMEVWEAAVNTRQFILRYEIAFDTLVCQMNGFGMIDGGSSWPLNVWMFIGMSYNNVTDVMSLYRRQLGGATQWNQLTTGLGKFPGTVNTFSRIGGATAGAANARYDLVSYWGPIASVPTSGRALTRTEFDAVYNDGAGLDIDQYT